MRELEIGLYSSSARKPDKLPAERATEYITCWDDVISNLAALESTSHSKIYSKIFNTRWREGAKFQNLAGQISYSKMTPLWLRTPVVLKYGTNRTVSLPFANCVLSNKNQIIASGDKILSAAIIDTWMRNEATVTEYIWSALLDWTIELPIVSSTIRGTNTGN